METSCHKILLSATLALSLLLSAGIFGINHVAAKEVIATIQNQRTIPSLLRLRIMQTTDVHAHILSYDYNKDAEFHKVGLAKTATLVKNARKEVKNSLLVDNGDLIQGTQLAAFKAKYDILKPGEIHPVFKAMNLMGYDIATLGNHEFNFGVDFLKEAYNDANFPYINANVYYDDHDMNPENDKNMFKPYKILKKKFTDETGKKHNLKIGFIGFMPPQAMVWDKANLNGKVIVKDIVETARKFIPEIQKKDVDLVIALAHTGFKPTIDDSENAVYPLSTIPGIDAIAFSHTHKLFPAKAATALDGSLLGPDKQPLPGIDNRKGTINGVPAVQAGFGGGSLGIIDLELNKVNGKWMVVDSQSYTREIWMENKDSAAGSMNYSSIVQPDEEIVKAVLGDHKATVQYINTPIGKTSDDIQSYFALVQDDPSIQVVTNAQKWYVEKYIKKIKPEYQHLPILSVSAPFKAGRNGFEDYTEIKKGNLSIRSTGDLYAYDNTLQAIKVNGAVIKEWLEMSAGQFNTIDPLNKEVQGLLNPNYPAFNFDVMDGVLYQFDVTKPPKYDITGKLINPASNRVINLTYNNKLVDPNQEFIVVTNNYRASGGGNFPGVGGSEVVLDAVAENRQILMKYIVHFIEIVPTVDQNWSIAPINNRVKISFTTSPKGKNYIKAGSRISFTKQIDEQGYGIYKLDLGKD
ncbi:bifunctional 2',3'-cyclic-nucleotide 2'-phosphodiesterase/3'-nucleotidase [Bacillus marasmi]|uniref:bifunctional 2',3'-cyclic-nucleotide 2'-phosphodiesterase/3'-nucleotidase n=1 Tax=Bacillus marasmi TaxID=1926279 RepID=UPI0011C9F091|nr:bifunctional 2',3'-cyclic-nucleotide 2'-phosphodiesterase/3'-nucleotidase [Bacillus marasmi]